MPGICITTLAVSPHPNDTQSFIHSSNFLPRCYSSNPIHTIAFLHRHLPSPSICCKKYSSSVRRIQKRKFRELWQRRKQLLKRHRNLYSLTSYRIIHIPFSRANPQAWSNTAEIQINVCHRERKSKFSGHDTEATFAKTWHRSLIRLKCKQETYEHKRLFTL